MAIDRKTLMQGNYIHYNTGTRFIVKQIMGLPIEHTICNSFHEPDKPVALRYDSLDLQPIPITEKWLHNLGFFKTAVKECVYQYYKPLPGFKTVILVLQYQRGNGYITKLVYGAGAIVLPEQNHVHQLQNLYAALAPGQYLELKNTEQWY